MEVCSFEVARIGREVEAHGGKLAAVDLAGAIVCPLNLLGLLIWSETGGHYGMIDSRE